MLQALFEATIGIFAMAFIVVVIALFSVTALHFISMTAGA